MNIKTIAVIGAGQMGSGIAQVHAEAGYKVYLYDISEKQVEKGLESIQKRLERNAAKGRITSEDQEKTMGNLHASYVLSDVSKAELIIEAASEKMEIKKAIFAQLNAEAQATAVLATNTSSLPITEIAAETTRPDRVIGMHFMNPVPVMKLVEVIRGLATSGETTKAVMDVIQTLQKTAVEVQDSPGFAANRILMPMINEAVFTLHEGTADAPGIDNVMKLGMNHPMGPLELADFIGLDTCLYIMEILHEGLGEDKYRPCPLLRKYVKAGWLGKKTGRGFYEYNERIGAEK